MIDLILRAIIPLTPTENKRSAIYKYFKIYLKLIYNYHIKFPTVSQ